MATNLSSNAEKKAIAATSLPSFPVNLLEIKRTVETILSQFGKNLIFQEYTTHDISHVDDMLATLDWLIPSDTQLVLSEGDWLMIVLAIYFHDMGLVVTEDEFKNHDKSEFGKFRAEIASRSPDYMAKIGEISDEKGERLLYQEFVRSNHARRVRSWIKGEAGYELGFAKAQIELVHHLLTPLDVEFRRDLALVCESHNLDDISDTTKYRLSRPYGNSEAETVNLQYSAVILRTVDLLQITKRRAPSVLYQLINPADPISQLEWLKQNAVKRIRPKPAVDKDGNASSDIPSDTIEIHATFNNDNGFFGLTTYLRYAGEQLTASYEVVQKSLRLIPKHYNFYWKFIDDSQVDAEGFIKKTFEFEIDQAKILDLLTGHTLYNDSSIVIRELTQNAIDAVRLQHSTTTGGPEKNGKVRIEWKNDTSELAIFDNGTGMSQDVIEKHLLKVGSSRYQDSKFKEKFPDFSPISRFGIGVLSAFMVADNVEIVTVSPEEEFARQISLRSVHGKYLIRLLDKRNDDRAKSIGDHGTVLILKFRRSVKKLDVLETLQTWIKFPRCHVEASIDGGEKKIIGFSSPKVALEEYIKLPRVSSWFGRQKLKVVESTDAGFTLAYVLSYSSHYRDWNFVAPPEPRSRDVDFIRAPIATCIEGVSVEFEIPGFRGASLLAVANATGLGAPKTNVARSSIEATAEKSSMVEKTYKILFDNVATESRRLMTEEGYSLTWAVDQIPYIIGPIFYNLPRNPSYQNQHQVALAQVPMYLVESEGKRSAISLLDLEKIGSFWTIESQLIRSVEQFIREAKAEVTAASLLKVSQGAAASLPAGCILTNSYNAPMLQTVMSSKFQIGNLVGNVQERRLDVKWEVGREGWVSRDELRDRLSRVGSSSGFAFLQAYSAQHSRRSSGNVYSPVKGVTASGLEDYSAVHVFDGVYLLPDTPITKLFALSENDKDPEELIKKIMMLEAISNVQYLFQDHIDHFYRQFETEYQFSSGNGKDELIAAAGAMSKRVATYNPLSWKQRELKI